MNWNQGFEICVSIRLYCCQLKATASFFANVQVHVKTDALALMSLLIKSMLKAMASLVRHLQKLKTRVYFNQLHRGTNSQWWDSARQNR